MFDLVQNKDVNVGPGHFQGDTLRVIKIFYTIQGEGPYAGCPAVFIRLAGCDRGDKRDCPFCDTYFEYEAGVNMDFWSVVCGMIATLPQPDRIKPMVVITGGEPMLQNSLPLFIRYLVVNNWPVIQIESNGDRVPPGWDPVWMQRDSRVKVVVSPKVVNGKYREPKDVVLEATSTFKFVIDHRPESPYYNVPSWVFPYSTHIFLSPITVYRRPVAKGEVANAWDQSLVDHEQTALNYKRVAELCLENGWRSSMQQHLFFMKE